MEDRAVITPYSGYGWNADETGETPGGRGGMDRRLRNEKGRDYTKPLPL